MKRIFLLAGSVGWGISVLGVFLPWSVMDIVLQNMGAMAPVTDLQIQYWFRMAAGGTGKRACGKREHECQ